jgi:hypothetical protein
MSCEKVLVYECEIGCDEKEGRDVESSFVELRSEDVEDIVE